MYKIGLESAAYFGLYEYEEGLKKLREHGWDCIDYSDFANPNSELYSFDDEKFRAFLSGVGEAARRTGVEISQMHGLWPTEDDTKEKRDKQIPYFIRSIEGAHYLGCKNVVIHPALPYGWDKETDKKVIWDANVERFSALLPYAERYGVTLCVENLPFPPITICTVEGVKEFVRYMDHPYLKACLDTGHANVWGRKGMEADVRLLADDLAVLHMQDNKGYGDPHLLPYQGKIRWKEGLAALREIGFNGTLSFETFISRATPEPSLEELRRAFARLARSMSESVSKEEL